MQYMNLTTKEIVRDDEAFDYVWDKVLHDDDLMEEFVEYYRDAKSLSQIVFEIYYNKNGTREELVDWFFSGNWIEQEEDEDDDDVELYDPFEPRDY